MAPTRALVFANGILSDLNAAFSLIQPGDHLVAADGGALHLKAMGLRPHLLVGDLDSLPAEDVEVLRLAGVEVRRYPAEKDETDLELAILAALEVGCRELRIIAALGGRLDQTLGNIGLLALPELADLDVRLDDGQEEVLLIRGRAALRGQKGETVSLLPWGQAVEGITTTGLRYPLYGETLYPERSRGISNEMLGTHAQVSVERGVLICVHTRLLVSAFEGENR
jgi:thiamine pyrophosphokinase